VSGRVRDRSPKGGDAKRLVHESPAPEGGRPNLHAKALFYVIERNTVAAQRLLVRLIKFAPCCGPMM